MAKVYQVKVENIELDRIEELVRKKVIDIITKEIAQHSRDLAHELLATKKIAKKKWYEDTNDN